VALLAPRVGAGRGEEEEEEEEDEREQEQRPLVGRGRHLSLLSALFLPSSSPLPLSFSWRHGRAFGAGLVFIGAREFGAK